MRGFIGEDVAELRKRAVFKFGSDVVTNEQGIDQVRVDSHAARILQYTEDHNISELIVSSGSVKTGRAEAPEIDDDQVLAGLGAAAVFMAWKQASKPLGRRASMVTATDYQISDPGEGSAFRKALLKDLNLGIIPIFNTNDKLNEEELQKRPWKGENDGPAAHIAILIGADALFLMTEKNGLFNDDGDTINTVAYDLEVRRETLDMVLKRGPEFQGIAAKVKAGFEATDHGIEVFIAGADESFHDIVAGNSGTRLAPKPQDM